MRVLVSVYRMRLCVSNCLLLLFTKPNVFSASIGNLPPRKAVLVTITYVTELAFEENGKLRFLLPTQPYAPNGRDPTPKVCTISNHLCSIL